MVRRKGVRRWAEWASVYCKVILAMTCVFILGKVSNASAGGEEVAPQSGGLKVGVFDFKAHGTWISPKTLWTMKKALLEEIERELGWQIKDVAEEKGYVELVKGSYRKALDYGLRHEVNLLMATHLYLLQGASQPFIDFYLIDPFGKKSRQINQNLTFRENWFSNVFGRYSSPLLWSTAKCDNQPTFPPVLRKEVAHLLSLAAQDLFSSTSRTPGDTPLRGMSSSSVHIPPRGVQVKLITPSNGAVTDAEQIIVEGFASDDFKATPALDLLFVLDSSGSLRGVNGPATDPHNARSRGAIKLIEKFPSNVDVRFGVVDFDGTASILAPLSPDRRQAIEAIEALDQSGTTNISLGIDLANSELLRHGRMDAIKVAILFTDGQQPLHGSHYGEEFDFDPSVIEESVKEGIIIHVLSLGEDTDQINLQEIAQRTGGCYNSSQDSVHLLEAFDKLDPFPAELERVILESENGAIRQEVSLFSGHFQASIPLSPGPNLIQATATSLRGESAVGQILVIRKPTEERNLQIQKRPSETNRSGLLKKGKDLLDLELLLRSENP